MRQEIRISQILEDLANGYTRTPETEGYDSSIGSIQEKYSLTNREVKALFSHPELKNKKTKKPLGFVLVNDTVQPENNVVEQTTVQTNPPVETPVQETSNAQASNEGDWLAEIPQQQPAVVREGGLFN